jgi:exopolyphosphatase/guanosine-5'-triphosphate,3'-diphosphate pyrophosphatase
MSPGDLEVIAGQLGRPPRDLSGIAARCPYGYPAVIETAPVLTEGTPNPTLLYLTCPTLAIAVSRVEAAGGVKAFKEWVRTDPDAQFEMERIARLYRERRAVLAGGDCASARLEAGIGGPRGPGEASCLHAYAAAFLAVLSGWLADVPGEGAWESEESRTRSEAAGLNKEPAPARSVEGIWTRFLPPVEELWCVDSRCGRWAIGEKRAAVDVGTISVRLLVAHVAGGEVRQMVRRAEVTRLGEGLQPGGPLSEVARQRTAAVVARCIKEARSHGVERPLLAGTSAAREAVGGREYIRSLGRDNRVPAVVLSGREEAALAYIGAALDLIGDTVVLDVGGGSTELIRRLEDGAIDAVSLELGASRATERWVKSDPPTSQEMESVRRETKRAVDRLRGRFGNGSGPGGGANLDDSHLKALVAAPGAAPAGAAEAGQGTRQPPKAPRLVGVAGTVTTLACLDAGLEKYDHEVLHLRTLSAARVRKLMADLSAMTLEERAALPCVQPGRAPVIVAGAMVLLATMETLGYEELTVSVRDLLDGLVLRGETILGSEDSASERAKV